MQLNWTLIILYTFLNTLFPALTVSNSLCNCNSRHAHNVAFEKSDLFFICMLRPLSTQIIIDDLEIQAAKVNVLTYSYRTLKTALHCFISFLYPPQYLLITNSHFKVKLSTISSIFFFFFLLIIYNQFYDNPFIHLSVRTKKALFGATRK